jgi:hypothetical protein
VVITFTEITSAKKLEMELREENSMTQEVLA